MTTDAPTPEAELAQMADQWWSIRTVRLAEQKKVEAMKTEEDQLQATILRRMEELHITAIGGMLVKLATKVSYEPAVADWPTFYSYIKERGEFDLLYRRINPAAVKERWENGVDVPGVQKYPVTKLSKSST